MKLHTTLLFVFLLATTLLQAQEVSADKLFYQAVYAEQIDGDLDKARGLYQQILKAKPDDRTIMAKTLFRLGLITEKDGSKKALKFYTQVVEEFPEQKDLIELVQARVDKLENANTFIDERDGHKYKYVQIGKQIWMAENLAYMPHVNPVKKQEYGIWVYDYNGSDVAEAKATENYQKYGCLYDWTMAMDIDPKYLKETWDGDSENHQGICPDGWHLPSDEDWIELGLILGSTFENVKGNKEDYFICSSNIADLLKSTYDWNSGGSGNNTSNFNLLPSGGRWFNQQDLIFEMLNEGTGLWSTTKFLNSEWNEGFTQLSSFARTASNLDYQSNVDNRFFKMPWQRGSGLSIRCLQESNNRVKIPVKPTPEKNKEEKVVSKKSKPVFSRIENRIVGHSQKGSTIRRFIPISESSVVFWNTSTKKLGLIKNKKLIWEIDAVIKGSSGNIATNGEIVVFSDAITTYGINLKDGSLIWKVNMLKPRTSPTISKDRCFVKVSGSELQCLNIGTGSLIWKYQGPENLIISDPIISDSALFFGFSTGVDRKIMNKKHTLLVSLDLKTGKENWDFQGLGATNIYAPVIMNNSIIFANHWDQHTYSISIDSGLLNWKFYTKRPVLDRVSISNDLIIISDFTYSQGKDEQLYALSIDGKLVWQTEVGFEGGNFRHHQPTVYKDKIFVCSNLGFLVFNLQDGKRLGLIELPEAEWVYSPVLNGSVLYVGTQNGLYSLKYPDFK